MLLLPVLVSLISLSEAVYEGKGQIYFTHYYQYSESGVRVIYRPEKYEYYSPLGVGNNAYIGYAGYYTEAYARSNYNEEVTENVESWVAMEWDSTGQYYYHNSYDSDDLKSGGWIGYGVAIFNRDSDIIYTDRFHYYNAPTNIQYCQVDKMAYSWETKCSTALSGSSGSGSSGSSSKTTNVGAIVGGVLAVIVLIGIVVGIAVCAKKGLLKCNKSSPQPTPSVQYISGQPSVNPQQQQQQQQIPAYQPIVPSAPAYQPPLTQQPPPYQPPVYQQPVLQPPAIITAASAPIIVGQVAAQPAAPAQANRATSSVASLLTPRNIEFATSAMDLMGGIIGACQG